MDEGRRRVARELGTLDFNTKTDFYFLGAVKHAADKVILRMEQFFKSHIPYLTFLKNACFSKSNTYWLKIFGMKILLVNEMVTMKRPSKQSKCCVRRNSGCATLPESNNTSYSLKMSCGKDKIKEVLSLAFVLLNYLYSAIHTFMLIYSLCSVHLKEMDLNGGIKFSLHFESPIWNCCQSNTTHFTPFNPIMGRKNDE